MEVLYLATDNNGFKVGYTKNIIQRRKSYKTHNPNIKILSYEEIPDKSIEKIIHMELVKRGYRKQDQPEWFYDSLDISEFKEIIKTYNERYEVKQ